MSTNWLNFLFFVNAKITFQSVNKEIRFKQFFLSVEKMGKVSMPTIAILFYCPSKLRFKVTTKKKVSIYFLFLRLKKERNVLIKPYRLSIFCFFLFQNRTKSNQVCKKRKTVFRLFLRACTITVCGLEQWRNKSQFPV